ncbi:MAG TPA: zinc-binding dehydrogenase [Streptosporangiaceae bacterium]
MRAVRTDPATAPQLRISEVPRPEPAPHQALVKVEAFSLNAGETRTARQAADAYVPGWDFAGVVEEPAADGGTPPKGTRVFGFVPYGAWAEYVVAGPEMMAPIPDEVSAAEAAAMPVAGATALLSLEMAGTLLGRRVLVTGAAGGVGRYACQLASLAGAEVVAISRRPALAGHLREDGVREPVIFPTIDAAKEAGRYDVILDGVGGHTLATALTILAPNGVCVTFGNGSGEPAGFDAGDFYHTPGARLEGLWLGNLIVTGADCAPMLARLAAMVADKRLHAPIDAVLPWTRVDEAATLLHEQSVNGKIVLTVG